MSMESKKKLLLSKKNKQSTYKITDKMSFLMHNKLFILLFIL